MYVPSSFDETDPERLLELCARYPFATVVTPGPTGLWISHLPLLARRRDGHVVLVGHFARANDHWLALGTGAPTTAIFHGPHAYVSPTWYTTAPAVPTWNYVVVHAVGRATAHDDGDHVARVVRELTERFEGTGAGAWSPDVVPAEFSARQTAAIVGLEIVVERLEGKVKLSQNRSAEDRAGVIARFEADGSDDTRALAAMMRAHLTGG
jgi:transcriptional regulator